MAGDDDGDPNVVTTARLAEFCGLSIRRMQQFAAEGVLVKAPQRRGRYLFLQSLQAIIKRLANRHSVLREQKDEALLFKAQEQGKTLAVQRAALEKSLMREEAVRLGLSQYVIGIVKLQEAMRDQMRSRCPNLPSEALDVVDDLVAHARAAGAELHRTGTYQIDPDADGA